MMTVAILGAAGRMGASLIRCAAVERSLRVGAAIEQPGHADIGKDAGLVSGIGPIGILISDNPTSAAACDVFIDFTFHAAVPGNLAVALGSGRGVVLGTTGLDEAGSRAVREAARTIPILWAPNMSRGVNLLFGLVEQAARALGLDYDAEIVEMHHRHKKDAPSGTALGLARHLSAGRKQNLEEHACYGRHGVTGERPAGQIGIHALRGGDVIGEHRVIFATEGERIELVHTATNRDAFARGALRAAVWLHGRRPGLYSMLDVLGLGGAAS